MFFLVGQGSWEGKWGWMLVVNASLRERMVPQFWKRCWFKKSLLEPMELDSFCPLSNLFTELLRRWLHCVFKGHWRKKIIWSLFSLISNWNIALRLHWLHILMTYGGLWIGELYWFSGDSTWLSYLWDHLSLIISAHITRSYRVNIFLVPSLRQCHLIRSWQYAFSVAMVVFWNEHLQFEWELVIQ